MSKERRTVDERCYAEYPEPRVYSKFRRPDLNDIGNMKPGVSQDRILESWPVIGVAGPGCVPHQQPAALLL